MKQKKTLKLKDMRLSKSKKGITLIALVVTIVVILILAAISITALVGENGLITRARKAKFETEKAQAYDKLSTVISEWQIEKIIQTTGKTFEDFLIEKFGSSNVINNGDESYNVTVDSFIFKVTEDGNIIYVGSTTGENETPEEKKIILSQNTLILQLEEGKTITGELTATLTGLEGEVTWSKEETIQDVTSISIAPNGNKVTITALAKGTATITAICEDKSASCTVEVKQAPISANSQPGLYSENGTMIYSWQQLLDNNYLTVSNGVLTSGCSNNVNPNENNIVGILVVDSSVTTVGDDGLNGLTKMTDVFFPDNVTFNTYTLQNTGIGDETVARVLEQMDTIPEGTFYGCKNITSVTIPGKFKTVASYAFTECPNLTSVCLNDGVKYIEKNSFRQCPSIYSISFPEGLQSIGAQAFYNCTSITELDLPDSLITISSGAFSATNITSIKIPESMNIIQGFNNCTKLSKVTLNGHETEIANSAFSHCNISTFDIHSNIKIIGDNALAGNKITSINIPDTVETIGIGVLEENTELVSVKLPSHLTTIPEYTFYGCSKLSTFEINNNVTQIGNSAFEKCNFSTFIIPSHIKTIGNYALAGNKMTSMDIPDTVETIGTGVLKNCTELISAKLPSHLTIIPERTFENCSKLSTFEISDKITRIDHYAFSGCSGLTTISIPSSVKQIGGWAFAGCTGITNLSVPSSVIEIVNYAFSNIPHVYYSGSAIDQLGNNWGALALN